jgi:hypothetical protein
MAAAPRDARRIKAAGISGGLVSIAAGAGAGFALYQDARRQNDLKNAGSILSTVVPI